jgi:hypothetical protein
LLARAFLAGSLRDVLILLCLLILVWLTRGLLFLSLPDNRSENAERENKQGGQTTAQGAGEHLIGRRLVDRGWSV